MALMNDTSAPESGSLMSDSGTPPADTGSLMADSGTPPEASAPEGDSGSLMADKEGQAPKPTAPEKYEAFQLGEGAEPDEAFIGAITPVFKDLGLSQDQAQKVMSALGQYAETAAEAEAKAEAAAYDQKVQAWRKEIKADPKWEERAVYAKRAVTSHPDAKVRQFFQVKGMGDHPMVISMLEHFGRLIGEDTLADGSGSGGTEKSAADVLYPSMSRK